MQCAGASAYLCDAGASQTSHLCWHRLWLIHDLDGRVRGVVFVVSAVPELTELWVASGEDAAIAQPHGEIYSSRHLAGADYH